MAQASLSIGEVRPAHPCLSFGCVRLRVARVPRAASCGRADHMHLAQRGLLPGSAALR